MSGVARMISVAIGRANRRPKVSIVRGPIACAAEAYRGRIIGDAPAPALKQGVARCGTMVYAPRVEPARSAARSRPRSLRQTWLVVAPDGLRTWPAAIPGRPCRNFNRLRALQPDPG